MLLFVIIARPSQGAQCATLNMHDLTRHKYAATSACRDARIHITIPLEAAQALTQLTHAPQARRLGNIVRDLLHRGLRESHNVAPT